MKNTLRALLFIAATILPLSVASAHGYGCRGCGYYGGYGYNHYRPYYRPYYRGYHHHHYRPYYGGYGYRHWGHGHRHWRW